jgi:7-cyano-7-deazaguanine synthase in queuosine biosynthesis
MLSMFVPAQEALDAANKAAEELQEQLQQADQAAADEASKAAELHAVEIQKMVLERTKLEVGITCIATTTCQHSMPHCGACMRCFPS